MLHLVLCFSIWILIFTYLSWRGLAITRQATSHLKRLHQIPCSRCIYCTGDYRLKCTVNPIDAMSEAAIDCRDFIDRQDCLQNDSTVVGCSIALNQPNVAKRSNIALK